MAETWEIPQGLPAIEASCSATDTAPAKGAAFWDELDDRAAATGLDASLDRALAGRPAPRVWVLVHEPGRPDLGAAAAFGFARALADRGQAALVLDGDDAGADVSRWAGREYAEGWIDVVRYGTSLLTSGVPLPFAGRTAYFLGVGTYAPAEVQPDELDQLLARLRRQADDLLVILPGGPAGAAWAQRADIRLLCHDQQTLTPPRLAAVVANLTAAGVAPTALVGFGRPAETVAEVPGEPDAAAPPAADPMPPADEPGAAEPATEAAPPRADDPPAPAPADDEPDPLPLPGPAGEDGDEAERSVAAALAALEEETVGGLDPEIVYARRRGTSGVFWAVALAAAVLIALVGVYYLRYVRVPDGSVFGDGPVAVVQPRLVGRPAGAEALVPAEPPATLDEDRGGSAAADTALAGGADGQADRVTADSGTAAGTETDAARDSAAVDRQDAAPGMVGAAAADESAAGVAPTTGAAAEPGPAPGAAADEPAFDPAPYTVPVGTGGWALQVYSLRDSTSAEKEIERLERQGIRAAYRVVELPGSGRWWRIYVGSFATRAEARAAEAPLFRKLRTDWAKPTRFTVAVTDTSGGR